jgi:hypothetical protein
MTRTFAFLAAASLAAALSACGNGRPAAAPPPAPAPVTAPSPVVAAPAQTVAVCVVEAGQLRELQAVVSGGDSLLADGRRLADVYPAAAFGSYASATRWYLAGMPITYAGRRYTRYEGPRVVGVGDVRRAGEFLGVPVFVAANHPQAERPAVIYVPTRRGCEFQAYRAELMA